jgi:hypothetical protein
MMTPAHCDKSPLKEITLRTKKKQFVRLFCGLLGLTTGSFLSMISSTTHPRWLLRPPSWIWFLSIRRQTPGLIHPIFLRLIGGDYRKVPFDDELHHSSKMVATAAILDVVSVDFLTNAWVDWSDFLVARHWG